MTRQSEKWIVRDDEGRIYGPYSTEQVIEKIDEGYFIGVEQVAVHPGGLWGPISKAPEFCDRLLDVLVSETKTSDLSQSLDDEGDDLLVSTSKGDGFQSSVVPDPESQTGSVDMVSNEPGSQVTKTKGTQVTEIRHDDETGGHVIELTDLKSLESKERHNPIRLPLVLIASAVVLAAGALLWTENQSADGRHVHLLAPRRGQSPLSDEKVKEKFRRAIQSFQTDTYTGYLRAQNELVEGLEGIPDKAASARKKVELQSMLCLVYRELWPFSYQDSQDMKVVSQVMQEAKRLDPGGLNGFTCEIVHLLLDGRYREAESITDSVLVEFSQAPTLLEIRGDIYMYVRDYSTALNYFNRARELWPNWQKTSVQEARARIRKSEFPNAIDLYQKVLNRVPHHAVAKIELGLLEAHQFNQLDKGFDLLTAGLESDERIPRSIEAKAYFTLASIYLKRNQESKALDYARRAYSMNPGNLEAKELIEKLAGTGAANKTRFEGRELVYLGDQYVRAGDCFSAQAQFKAAFEVDKKNGVAAMKAGKCLWQLNQSNDAIEWLKKAISSDPELISAYIELADYYAQRFDYQSAVLVLRKAQRISPKSYEIYRGFATVELRRNNFAGSRDFSEKALALYESDLETNLIMARSQLGLQNYQEAQRYATKANELDSNNTESHIIFAKAEAGLRGVSSGANYLQQLINRFVITGRQQIPQAAIDYRIALGELYLQEERFSLAEEAFKQAISLDPENKKALINLGKSLQAQNLAPLALESFLKAAVLDPADADPIFLSGQVYTDVGKYPEAIRQFERVLRINTRYPRAHYQIGHAALKTGDAKRALEEAMLEREINPNLSDSYLLAAEAYFVLKQYSNCAQEYQKAVSKREQGAIVFVKMARCYRLAGSLDSAQSLLRRALSLESGNPDIYKEQGAIFHMKGMADEAVASYDTYLKLVPNALDRREVEGRIQAVQAGDMTVRD